jgi:hypothetical protein
METPKRCLLGGLKCFSPIDLHELWLCPTLANRRAAAPPSAQLPFCPVAKASARRRKSAFGEPPSVLTICWSRWFDLFHLRNLNHLNANNASVPVAERIVWRLHPSRVTA